MRNMLIQGAFLKELQNLKKMILKSESHPTFFLYYSLNRTRCVGVLRWQNLNLKTTGAIFATPGASHMARGTLNIVAGWKSSNEEQ